jgi:hypothetical protein
LASFNAVKGGESLGDKESSEEEEEVSSRLDVNAGGKTPCLRHFFDTKDTTTGL